MKCKDWRFVVQDWQKTVSEAREGDMLYCDPPVGRHTDYYNQFTEDEADNLARALRSSPSDFAISMWLKNKFRKNDYVTRWFAEFPQRTVSHFYHVGPTEKLRNPMTEVVILSPNAAASITD